MSNGGKEGVAKEVELCWDKTRTGLKVLGSASVAGSTAQPAEMLAVYGEKEQWIYDKMSNRVLGYGNSHPKVLPRMYDCRQHVIWLTIMGSATPELTHLGLLRRMKAVQLQVFRSDDERLRFKTDEVLIEFDLRSGFSPVLFELHLDPRVRQDSKTSNPVREKYEVAKDKHGVWYCKSLTRSLWRKGIDSDPSIQQVMMVHEYDSHPPREKLRLDYQTLGAPAGTPISSFIQGRSGSSFYGLDHSGIAQAEGAALSELGRKMQTRGFAENGRKE